MGASVCQSLANVVKDFVVLVIISCLIAIPVSYYFMDSWLQKYEYRTEISWWIFVVSRHRCFDYYVADGEFSGSEGCIDEPGEEPSLRMTLISIQLKRATLPTSL